MKLFLWKKTLDMKLPRKVEEVFLSDVTDVIVELSDGTRFAIWKGSDLDKASGMRIRCDKDKMFLIQVEANNSIKLREVEQEDETRRRQDRS